MCPRTVADGAGVARFRDGISDNLNCAAAFVVEAIDSGAALKKPVEIKRVSNSL